MWLGGKLHIMDNRGETWKTLLVMIPILAATLVAVSRIMDARHHPFDVITGSLLGVVCAIVSYSQYFPPLSEAWRKGRAYPIRTWGSQPAHPVHGKLDSESESITPLRDHEADRLTAPDLRNSLASPNLQIPQATGYAGNGNPYAPPAYHRRSHDHDPDGNWSSSEDDVANGYEMQHRYAMAANPATPAARGYSPPFDTNTAYAPAGQVSGAGIHRPTEVVGGSDRGRQLTEVSVGNV
jgi:Membrane-associated phospholipid phosphatase